MRFCVLGSGSKGNSTYIEAGNTRILIDAGFSGIEVERRLGAIGVDAASLSAILITHEHSDHIRGAAILSRKHHLPVFVSPKTCEAAGKVFAKLFAGIDFCAGTSFVFQNLHIHPFSVSHDAADPVGFIVSDGQWSVGYCTDTGTVFRLMAHRLHGCHGLVLECNHDPDMLKNGPYPPALQQRIRSKSGHLANGEAASFLTTILHEGLEHVVLSHLSGTNNDPELAHQAIVEALQRFQDEGGEPCRVPRITVASQDRVGELVTFTGSRK